MLETNTIYCGDNLEQLKKIPDNSVDLIYIDPPFNSSRKYEVFWEDAQEKRAFHDHFGDVEAYISYMRPRVVELYRVLKPTGSFYYHCDWHASHYVKIMLDQIFDFGNFRNEIVWSYKRYTAASNRFQRLHDTVFFYGKGDEVTFNDMRDAYGLKSGKADSHYKEDEDGKWFRWQKRKGQEPYKVYLSEGVRIGDVWEIPIINASSKERLGFPTQKPLALMDRIIEASSNKGDVVLDAFCGCGTTLASAQKYGRKWIGIDISPTACRVISQRMWKMFGLVEDKNFKMYGLPRSETELAIMPHFEFQNWAVIALGGIPNRIKSGDFGIDGKLYPIEQEKIKDEELGLFGAIDVYYPIQVKQKNKAGRPDIDAFETAMRRDKRQKGYFVSFDFSSDAIREIQRVEREDKMEIVPVTVKELLADLKV